MIQLLGFPTNLGLPYPQQHLAPVALRNLGLKARVKAAGETITDRGDLSLPRGDALERGEPLLRAVLEAARHQARTLAEILSSGLPLTLGGDHSTSLGTIMGLAKAGLDFDVVWVDAHADFNTPETSPSGNPHGMVLALLAGLTPYLPPILSPQRIHILGARDIDPGERLLVQQHGLNLYGPQESMARLDAILAGLGPRVFLSFDMDSLAPELVPAVRTPVAGGFSMDQALEIVTRLARTRDLVAVDLVEYYPDLDQESRTGKAALTVLEALFRARQIRLAQAAALQRG